MSQPTLTTGNPPIAAVPARKSFAQVAAAANKPIIKKVAPPQAPPPSSTPRLVAKPVDKGLAAKPVINDGPEISIAPIEEIQVPKAPEDTDAIDTIAHSLEVTHLDGTSAGTSQTGNTRKDNSDTKSVTSRTTLTLDEKESLRPDDSASMQAAVEEDLPSPPSSVVAHSKPESDPDAQAFRDQLRQIGLTGDQRVIMPRAQRPLSMSAQRNGAPAFQAETPAETPPQVLEIIRPRVTDPQMWIMPPDEKLLEALASPKDRLFVLKVEQDLIDFIKDPKEEFLQLPSTNSFYRMLSHKLADYYMLRHIVDDAMSSVRIYRQPGGRLPPPLARSAGSTPPPTGPTRKIMRRNGEARTPDRAQVDDASLDSFTSSKAPSDNGSGGDLTKDGRPPHGAKSKMTRAERQNRYDEARARIFKGFEVREEKDTKEMKDAANGTNDVGISRSSSASGAKRNKKQKKPKDDGFEARSAFDQYGRRISETQIMHSPTETPSYGQYYFDANGQMIPAGFGFQPGQEYGMNPLAMSSPNGFNGGAMPGMSMYGTQQEQQQQQQHHQYGMSSPSFEQPNFGTMNGNFDSSQFSSMNSQDRTPKGTAPSLNYNQDYMQQDWSQSGYPNPYEMYNYQYPGFNPGFQQYSGGQMMQQTSPGFNGFMQPGPNTYNQGYFGNGFHNQNFNPQSQSFVPNASSMHNQQYASQQQNGSVFAPNGSGYPMQHQTSTSSSSHQPQQHHNTSRGKNNKQQNTLSKWPTPASLPAKPPQPTLPQHQSLPPKPIPTR